MMIRVPFLTWNVRVSFEILCRIRNVLVPSNESDPITLPIPRSLSACQATLSDPDRYRFSKQKLYLPSTASIFSLISSSVFVHGRVLFSVLNRNRLSPRRRKRQSILAAGGRSLRASAPMRNGLLTPRSIGERGQSHIICSFGKSLRIRMFPCTIGVQSAQQVLEWSRISGVQSESILAINDCEIKLSK
jgi:hypothetical protein